MRGLAPLAVAWSIGFAVLGGVQAQAQSQAGNDKLAGILMQSRAAAGDPAAAAALAAPQRSAERAELLRQGEAALARGDAQEAERRFDRAALLSHAADTELGLVRSYMQKGEYRRALAFGAHTAGAHLDVVGGTALYAWLLDMGAQGGMAQRLLRDAAARTPGNPVVAAVSGQLASPKPLADGDLLKPPVRLAPYGAQALPARARVVSSGVLIDQGRHALAPPGAARPGAEVWVRNGLGKLAKAQYERALPGTGLALLRLAQPLPMPPEPYAAPRDAFPGSIGYAVDYVESPDAEPRWPLLRNGFIGAPAAGPAPRELGIALPAGPRGGPVFDAGGRLAGLAVAQPGAADRLVLASQLQQALGARFGYRADGGAPSMAVDQIYEAALKSALQVIAVRR